MNLRTTFGCIALVMALAMVFLIGSGVVSAQTYDDIEYLEWCIEKGDLMSFFNEITSDALEDLDFVTLKKSSLLTYNLCLDVLDEIDQFDISPGYLSNSIDENRAFYKDKKWVAYYDKKAADAFLSGDMDGCSDFLELSTSYMESANEHLYKALEYAEKNFEEIENAPSSIDSDRDGVPDDYDYAPYDPNIKAQSDFILIWFGTFVVIAAIIVIAYLWIKRKSKIK